MSNIVMTIHTFDLSCAGFFASEGQSSSCPFVLPARRSRKLLINEAGNRHFRILDAKLYGEMLRCSMEISGGEEAMVVDLHGLGSARTFIHKRDNPNFNFNEVSL
jgi:hypothetical protein